MVNEFIYIKGHYRIKPKKKRGKIKFTKPRISKIPYFEKFFARNSKETLNTILVIWIISFCFLFFGGNTVYAKRIHTEKWYQQKWCKQIDGKTEVRTKYNTRID